MMVTIDDHFPPSLIAAANAEWPSGDWPHWHVYGDGNARKLATKDESRVTPACRLLLHEMAKLSHAILPSGAFPDLNLHGAGMHEIPDGGFLKRHLDSDSHPNIANWRRMASGVLYLNDEFEGGDFCLEDDGVTHRIESRPNRLVIFQPNDFSYHWVEHVRGGSRRTLAMFWWRISDGSPKRKRAEFT